MSKIANMHVASSTAGSLSRRSLFKLGGLATAVAAGASLAGCAPQPKSASMADTGSGATRAADGTPSFLIAPEPITEFDETRDFEVVVVGAGVSGMAAAMSAAEAGAKIACVQREATPSSQGNMAAGVDLNQTSEAGKQALISYLIKLADHRSNRALLEAWADNSFEALSWFREAASAGGIEVNPDEPQADRVLHISGYDVYLHANTYFGIGHGEVVKAIAPVAAQAGVEFFYSTPAVQLATDDSGKVTGVVCESGKDHVLFNAAKGVILATGDYQSDEDMVAHYCPDIVGFPPLQANRTGDGHKMAMWAGAVMEDGPYAPMTHSLGTNSVGIDPFLMVNQDGKRFANEDVGAQELQNAIKRQKGGVSYQIFDSKWKEQLSAMPQCFGGVTHYIPPEQEAEYEHAINHFAAGYASDTYFQGEIEQGSIIPADSIEELAKAVNIPADALVETVERYNELAHAGKDADFSKVSTRLFPVENPPYYAVPFGDSGMLVLIGGIDCDVDCRALDAEKNPVPGLFVAGNTMGGRFLVDYPVTVAGASHSMAMSFGRLAGRKAAEGK